MLRNLWIAVVLLMVSHTARAFCPDISGKCLLQGVLVTSHEFMTEWTIYELDDEFFPSIPLRQGMKDAAKEIARANASTDHDHFWESAYHYDGENYPFSAKQLKVFTDAIVTALEQDEVAAARTTLGISLHTIQDFYSHSNYIEKGGIGSNRGIWDPTDHLTFASPIEGTCEPCPRRLDGSYDCSANLTTSNLTTGYFFGEDKAPLPFIHKCRHGGLGDLSGLAGLPAGGLNKDTPDPWWSPHYLKHPDAVHGAEDATKAFIKEIAEKIGNGQKDLTNSKLRELLGVGPDLAIALGVCAGRLPNFKSAITSVVDARVGTEQEPIKYVLVGFTDDGSGVDTVLPAFVTDDSAEFKTHVNALTIDTYGGGTGDCPAPTMKATLVGMGEVEEGANLFLMTDVDPDDYHLVGDVISLAREKEIKIYPQIYEGCPPGQPHDPAYELIASGENSSGGGSGGSSGGGSGGQSFHGDANFNHSDIYTITGYINTLTRTNGVEIFTVSDTTSRSFAIPVDSSITQLVFSLTNAPRLPENGYTPLTLTRPDGTTVRYDDPGVDFKYHYNSGVDGLVVTITTLMTGNWTVSINNQPSGNRFYLNVSGDSTLNLNRFSFVEPTSNAPHPGYFDIDGFPSGQTIKGLAILTGTFSTANFELWSRTGALLTPLSLSPIDEGLGQFLGEVTIPSQAFLAYVKGSLNDGTQYQRVYDKDFVPQSVTVSAPHEQVVSPGASVNYNFIVTNHGPSNTFYVFGADDKNPTWKGATSPSQVTLGTNQQATVGVQLNVPSNTPEGALNYLSLSATTGGASFTGIRNFATVKTLVVAPVDNTAPTISNLQFSRISSREATLSFDTSEDTTAQVRFGLDCASLDEERSSALSTAHALVLDGLSPLTTYFATVTVMDPSGNTSTDTNEGYCIVFHTNSIPRTDFQSGSGGYSGSGGSLWHRTTTCLSTNAGHSTPASFYFGQDGTCNYATNQRVSGTLSSPISGVPSSTQVELRFKYLLGTEGPGGDDQASVNVVANGTPTLVASNVSSQPVMHLVEGGWQSANIDITSIASNASVGVQFVFDSRNKFLNNFPGFYVDDIEVYYDGVDSDTDGDRDANDNCPTIANPGQEDRNGDGLGDACTPSCDLNADGLVDLADALLANRIVAGYLPADGLLGRGDVAPATGGPTDGTVDMGDALVILRAARGEALAVCHPMP